MGERPSGDERVDRCVAATFEVGQRLRDRPEHVDRADALGAPGGVRGATLDAQAEGESPRVRRHHVELRRLGDHACVRTPPALERGERAETAVLLPLHRRQHDVPPQADPGHAQRPDRPQRRDQAGLHVATAPAMETAVADVGGVGRGGPHVRIAYRHDVDVPVQHQGRPVAGTGQPADDAPRLAPVDLHAGEVGMGGHRREVDRPVVDVQPGIGETPGDVGLGVVLGIGTAHARDPHERRQLVQEPVGQLGYGIEHLRHLIGHPITSRKGSSRSTRVRPAHLCLIVAIEIEPLPGATYDACGGAAPGELM
jgi:hypothetical protein